RTQLTKMSLAGKVPLTKLPIFSPETSQSSGSLEPLSIRRLEATVTLLQQPDREVMLHDGTSVPFDALLLASGSRPRELKVEGGDGPNVFTIRHPDDLRRMDPLLRPGARAVLIGDSFIAFEAASALTQRGLHATVVANSRQPFLKKFGEAAAEALLQLHRNNGVHLHAQAEVTAISPVAVTLGSGAEIPADVVIVAIGVEPVTNYAPQLPAGKTGGFAVGRDLRLAPNIWCAGDIASVDGTRIEHWRLAEQHGRTAAEAMLAYTTGNAQGPAQPFSGVPFFWTFHFGKRLGYAGHADTWDRIVTEGSPQQMDFLNFYLQDGNVAAVLGCGRDTALAALMEPLRAPLSLPEAQTITAAAAAG
ncbi:MAG: FAD-dependent oxidoreductase, partial [Rhodospirillales bacterium]|nr:FAD-dependent oxidoreductase [Acetobacter sp.]